MKRVGPSGMSIGEISGRCGLPAATIRYYEERGLLPAVARGGNGRRSYGWPDVQRLQRIIQFRACGIGLDDIRVLLGLVDSPSDRCEVPLALLSRHLSAITAERERLLEAERALRALVAGCSPACRSTADCLGSVPELQT